MSKAKQLTPREAIDRLLEIQAQSSALRAQLDVLDRERPLLLAIVQEGMTAAELRDAQRAAHLNTPGRG